MIDLPASKSFAKTGAVVPHSKAHSPLLWLNLLCLDAPAIAVTWQWLFARAFGVAIPQGASAALFGTAWLIYLADRFGDSLSLGGNERMSARQRFCLRHRRAWLLGLGLLAFLDLAIVALRLDGRAIVVGAGIGLVALIYLVINRLRPSLWSVLPLKECSIGFVFAAGTMVGLLRGLTSAALPVWLCFALLCSLNCISIAIWERELDHLQERVSIATAFPQVSRYLWPALVLLAFVSLGCGRSALHVCIASSALALACVHLLRDRIEFNLRSALADLVLLAPALVAICSPVFSS